jgi:hypothetical protein
MRRATVLVVLITVGSALCWWPVIMQPNLDLPFWWLPLTLIALGAGFATILSNGRWVYFMAASFLGTFAGALSGFVIWRPTDRIDASFVQVVTVSAVLASIPMSVVAGITLRRARLSNEKARHAVWFALVCCVAFGPVTTTVTPPLVAQRVVHNDRLAAERMASLSRAAQQTIAETGDPQRICDQSTLERHYSGPPFRERDW